MTVNRCGMSEQELILLSDSKTPLSKDNILRINSPQLLEIIIKCSINKLDAIAQLLTKTSKDVLKASIAIKNKYLQIRTQIIILTEEIDKIISMLKDYKAHKHEQNWEDVKQQCLKRLRPVLRSLDMYSNEQNKLIRDADSLVAKLGDMVCAAADMVGGIFKKIKEFMKKHKEKLIMGGCLIIAAGALATSGMCLVLVAGVALPAAGMVVGGQFVGGLGVGVLGGVLWDKLTKTKNAVIFTENLLQAFKKFVEYVEEHNTTVCRILYKAQNMHDNIENASKDSCNELIEDLEELKQIIQIEQPKSELAKLLPY